MVETGSPKHWLRIHVVMKYLSKKAYSKPKSRDAQGWEIYDLDLKKSKLLQNGWMWSYWEITLLLASAAHQSTTACRLHPKEQVNHWKISKAWRLPPVFLSPFLLHLPQGNPGESKEKNLHEYLKKKKKKQTSISQVWLHLNMKQKMLYKRNGDWFGAVCRIL